MPALGMRTWFVDVAGSMAPPRLFLLPPRRVPPRRVPPRRVAFAESAAVERHASHLHGL